MMAEAEDIRKAKIKILVYVTDGDYPTVPDVTTEMTGNIEMERWLHGFQVGRRLADKGVRIDAEVQPPPQTISKVMPEVSPYFPQHAYATEDVAVAKASPMVEEDTSYHAGILKQPKASGDKE